MKQNNRKFASIFLWSMLILQTLLMGLMVCFFYSLVREGITNAFNQELTLEANRAGGELNDTDQMLQTGLASLANNNALRVSLRLDMESRIRELLEQEQKTSFPGGSLYLCSSSGRFFPAPSPALGALLEFVRGKTDFLETSTPHITRFEDQFVAVLHQKILLREGRDLGELFMKKQIQVN